MSKQTTLLAVRVEKNIKEKATLRASGLGISLAQAVKDFLADFGGGKSPVSGRDDDDLYLEFYENNTEGIHFDPPLTLEQFGVLLQESFKYGKTGKRTRKVSRAGQR